MDEFFLKALELLELKQGCSFDDVRKAYTELALMYHPDRCPLSIQYRAEEKMKEINIAYEYLSGNRELLESVSAQRGDTGTEKLSLHKVDPNLFLNSLKLINTSNIKGTWGHVVVFGNKDDCGKVSPYLSGGGEIPLVFWPTTMSSLFSYDFGILLTDTGLSWKNETMSSTRFRYRWEELDCVLQNSIIIPAETFILGIDPQEEMSFKLLIKIGKAFVTNNTVKQHAHIIFEEGVNCQLSGVSQDGPCVLDVLKVCLQHCNNTSSKYCPTNSYNDSVESDEVLHHQNSHVGTEFTQFTRRPLKRKRRLRKV